MRTAARSRPRRKGIGVGRQRMFGHSLPADRKQVHRFDLMIAIGDQCSGERHPRAAQTPHYTVAPLPGYSSLVVCRGNHVRTDQAVASLRRDCRRPRHGHGGGTPIHIQCASLRCTITALSPAKKTSTPSTRLMWFRRPARIAWQPKYARIQWSTTMSREK